MRLQKNTIRYLLPFAVEFSVTEFVSFAQNEVSLKVKRETNNKKNYHNTNNNADWFS